ncbi:MAG: CBASS oligonucleotide cyclase [Bacteriovoracaceae bacterium]
MSKEDTAVEPLIKNFVKFISPDPDKTDEIRDLKNRVKENIKNQAIADGLTVKQTPDSGSFATKTGLRRHMLGNSEVLGQDVDLPFVVAPKDKDGESLTYLLDRFEKYAIASYPDTKRKRTKSSIQLEFESYKAAIDLVPLFYVPGSENQILVRADGERRETNISKHKDFILNRTKSSKEASELEFNNIIRLLKWWRCECQSNGSLEVPSFLINLLCAHAYDNRKLRGSYIETLADWFGFLAGEITARRRIVFTDFTKGPGPDSTARWQVIDPVNPANNIVENMKGYELEELTDWFSSARDRMADVVVAERMGERSEAIELLSGLFGSSFANNCEAE